MSDPLPTADAKVAIPASLQRQLAEFQRKLWRTKVLEAVAAGAIGLLVSFLVVYALDRVWQTPGVVRLAILLLGVLIFAGFGPWWLHRWVWKHRREDELARLISKRYPGLGDRLLGVIELQQAKGGEGHSARLRMAAMDAVAAEVERRQLDGALPPPQHKKWLLTAGGLLALTTGVFLVSPRSGRNALVRWLLPFSKTERYTFTRLAHPPMKLAVPYGEPLSVKLTLAKDSDQHPGHATGRYDLQQVTKADLIGDSYVFRFPGQQEKGTIVFKIGDLRHSMFIEPVQRPSVESVIAHVIPPDYLGIPERTVDLKLGGLSVVEGSRLKIELTTQRPLTAAVYGPLAGARAETAGELTIHGNVAVTPEIPVGREPFDIPFTWTDEFGMTGDSGFRVKVDALPDAAPTVYLQGIDRQKVLLPEETVDFELLSEDDFGVKLAGIEWKGEFTRPTDEKPAKGDLWLGKGGPEERRFSKNVAFSPAAFGIAPQRISLRGYSEDFLPGRGRVYSEPVTLYVLTRDEHAQMLKAQFDKNVSELEDLARRETDLFDENKRLEKLKGEELQTQENREKLLGQERAEGESTQRMEDLKERMEKLMQDSARNGGIDKQTLQKMAESLRSMQELSEKDLPEVEGKLGDSADPSSTPEKTSKDLAEGVEKQKKVLEKMQASIDSARDANKRFEAGTFVNRLKKAASEQDGIASTLVQAFSRILGVRQPLLDPSDQRRLVDVTKQQLNTAADVRWLQEDLAHYFARTQMEPFREILDAMRQEKIDVGLDDLTKELQVNHSFQATDHAKRWAGKLNEWAGKLEGKIAGDQGAGGGGGSPQSAEDEDFEFMLRVMKMVQTEQDLRARTRALEQLRRSAENSMKP